MIYNDEKNRKTYGVVIGASKVEVSIGAGALASSGS